jgi:hypothetical protein
VIEYDIPVKTGKEKTLPPIALDWTRRWEEMHGHPASKRLEELIGKEPHNKLINTLRFARYCSENKDWHQRSPEAFEGKRLQMRTISESEGSHEGERHSDA